MTIWPRVNLQRIQISRLRGLGLPALYSGHFAFQFHRELARVIADRGMIRGGANSASSICHRSRPRSKHLSANFSMGAHS
ncbi:MAG: hypothetical protein JNL98_10665 [Bryobacterales bacterium]|nr:hypothetical protein [Bryobacterales bacterium]